MDFEKIGYEIIDENKLRFIFNPTLFEDDGKSSGYFIAGSFNDWNFHCPKEWELSLENPKKAENQIFILEKTLESLMKPGNSGYPEYRIYSKSSKLEKKTKSPKIQVLKEKQSVEGYVFCDNKLIVLNEAETKIIAKLNEKAKIKRKADFNIKSEDDMAKISNVRLVPGTKNLYRGYHPYKKSRPELDTENLRIKLVKKAFENLNINCDITLCGNEKPDFWKGESKSKRLKEIEKNNNRLCVDIEYNLVYYASDSDEFKNTLKEISHFIIARKGPYYLHCRLGSDRTGVISSVFGALAGATWEEIAEDYEKTANMGTGEVRSRKLLEYSLTKMLKTSPCDNGNAEHSLSSLMNDFFLEEKILNQEEIAKLIERLKN